MHNQTAEREKRDAALERIEDNIKIMNNTNTKVVKLMSYNTYQNVIKEKINLYKLQYNTYKKLDYAKALEYRKKQQKLTKFALSYFTAESVDDITDPGESPFNIIVNNKVNNDVEVESDTDLESVFNDDADKKSKSTPRVDDDYDNDVDNDDSLYTKESKRKFHCL